MLKIVSELIRLAFPARHYNLSRIVITQQLTSIAKAYRENISKLVTFYNPNRNDMKTITDNYLYGVSNQEIKSIVEKLKNNKYAWLDINLNTERRYKMVSSSHISGFVWRLHVTKWWTR